MELTAKKKTRRPAARGNGVLYLRSVDARVAADAKAIAAARGWTLSQLLARLLELREGSLDICRAHPNQMSAPLALLLEKLELDRRAI